MFKPNGMNPVSFSQLERDESRSTTMNPPFESEACVAVKAVQEATGLCRAVASEISPEVLAKKDKSPVTVADFGSQALVCRALAGAFPDDPVIAEEDSSELREAANSAILEQVVRHVRNVRGSDDAHLDAATICAWIDRGGTSRYCDRFWTVDPIDGTKGFLRGEQYAVALALVVDGEVVVAALACPNLPAEPAPEPARADSPSGALFWAVRGRGAFVAPIHDSGFAEPAKRNRSRAIAVNPRDDASATRFCESVESGHSAHGDAASVAARLGILSAPVRMDSQAKYAVVARGEADIYLRLPTSADYRERIWDHAAGALIVAEAGGIVTDISGRPLDFRHGRELANNRGVIVTNRRLHERVIEAVAALGIGRT
jgi:3'(2'), 5'-bisphosphate nucleotidase